MKIRLKSLDEVNRLKRGWRYNSDNWPYDGTKIFEVTRITKGPFYEAANSVFDKDEFEVISD